jgi:hypothetical protein
MPKMAAVCTMCVMLLLSYAGSSSAQWGANGERYISPGLFPRIISSAPGEYIVISDSAARCYAQRISNDGYDLWNPSGICFGGSEDGVTHGLPRLVSDGHGGAIMTWASGTSTGARLGAARIDSLGTVLWSIAFGGSYSLFQKIVSDDDGGAIVVWQNAHDMVLATRIDASGRILWTTQIYREITGWFFAHPEVSADGASGAIIAWKAYVGEPMFDFRAQRIDSIGNALWGPGGISIGSVYGSGSVQQIVEDGKGGAILCWTSTPIDDHCRLLVQRVDSAGNKLWESEGVSITDYTGYPRMISDRSGGAIVVFNRGGTLNPGFYAQRVDPYGDLVWGSDCSRISDNSFSPRITSNGIGLGAIVVWSEQRDGTWNLYAQKVDDGGNLQWQNRGILVHMNLVIQGSEVQDFDVVSDGLGGAIVVWDGVYARRILNTGEPPVVATLLQGYATALDGACITISWTLSEAGEDVDFVVERATRSNGPFRGFPSKEVDRDALSFNFRDEDTEPQTSYWYRVEYREDSEQKILFEAGPITTPAMPLTLYQNHPNPFNPSTTISYYVPDECKVILDIYDASGRRISRLVREEQEKGFHTVGWKGVDSQGKSVSSGIYFYRLTAGKEMISKKMVLLR